MTPAKTSPWTRIGVGITRVRLFLSNLFFFAFLAIALLFLFSGSDRIKVPDGGALVLNPGGVIVEQRSLTDPLQRWLSPGSITAETELASVLKALERARDDDRIRLLVLNFDDLQGVSTAHADAIGEALAAFRAEGKEIVSYGNYYAQQPYLMASAANAVYMHPLGQLLLPGYQIENLYFAEALEKLNINIHVFRAGQYKEFVEPYTRSDMSPEAREANSTLVATLWAHYGNKITQRRDLEPERFDRYTQFLDQALAETGGDLARLAVEYHLVDELLTPDQARARIGDKVGFDGNGDFRGIDFTRYLQATAEKRSSRDRQRRIGVITAEGPIVMSGPVRGVIAADHLIELIREAREDDTIGALVVRIASPGGSSFASELIRQELELTQLAGKPVVVSMGSVAASGGYWIAATADAIVAEPMTLTGSIGVFGIFPTFEGSLGALGVRTDGVATSSLGNMSPFSPLSEPVGKVLQASTESIYTRFVNLVARGRDLTPDAVERLAQGRVWLGTTALELGLVDQLGDRTVAIHRAAELAGLTDYGVIDITPPMSPGQLLLEQLLGDLTGQQQAGWGQSALAPIARQARATWTLFETLNDPLSQYAVCLVCTPGRGGAQGPW